MHGVLALLSARAAAGVLHGLPTAQLRPGDAVRAAFRMLQSGRNMGKVVVRVRARRSTPAAGAHAADGRHGRARAAHGAVARAARRTRLVLASRGGALARGWRGVGGAAGERRAVAWSGATRRASARAAALAGC